MTREADGTSRLKHLISFDEAIARMKRVEWNRAARTEIAADQSLGMISAETVISEAEVPSCNRSAVDGYVVRHSDVTGASPESPISLVVSGRSGFEDIRSLAGGQCLEISTGGRIPEGADAVIMSEYVSMESGRIMVVTPTHPWENVSRKGEDISQGMEIIANGDLIRPWHIAALVAAGKNTVKVCRKIRMGIMSTGNEIYAGSRSGVRNTTQPLLLNHFRSGPTETFDKGVYPDDYEKIRKGVISSLDESDVLVVTGGSSVGSADISISVLSDLGNKIFRGVLVRPGRTISLFEIGGKPVFSVSGLPVAAMTSLEAFYSIFMTEILGFQDQERPVRARLTENIVNQGGMRSFVRLKLSATPDSLEATPLRITGSGLISSLLLSDGVTVVPESVEGFEKGEYVWVKLAGRCA